MPATGWIGSEKSLITGKCVITQEYTIRSSPQMASDSVECAPRADVKAQSVYKNLTHSRNQVLMLILVTLSMTFNNLPEKHDVTGARGKH